MSSNAVNRFERKAEKYVNGELAQIESISDLSLEEQIEASDERFKEIITAQNREEILANIHSERFNSYDAIKRRFITMFCSGMYSKRQLARQLGISENTVHKWLHNEEIRKAIEAYQAEEDIIISSALKALRVKAIEKASELLDADNEMVQAIMVRDVLDRTGHKPVEKKQVEVNMTYEERLQQVMIQTDDYVVNDNETKINTEGEVKSD